MKTALLKDDFPEVYQQLKYPDESLTRAATKIVDWVCDCGYEWNSPVHYRTKKPGGNKCPACTSRVLAVGINDLQTTHPALSDELVHPTLSVKITAASTRRAKWVCRQGHQWEAQVYRRAKQNTRCPYCSGNRVLPGFNDLKTTHPQIFAILSNPVDGQKVSAGSSRALLWKCDQGHKWRGRVSDVVSYKNGCPYCSGKLLVPENSLLAKYPDIAAQWHPDNDLTPDEVLPSSGARVWWICSAGHEWDAVIYSRTRGHRCPKCILHGTSKEEIAFADDIEMAGYKIKRNTRQVIPPFELDIYIPSHRCGIEFNGVYWHSTPDAKVRDEKKAVLCKEAGVTLVVVTDKQYKINPEATIKDVIKRVERCQDGEDD